ncbi:hypothetical protein Poly51_14650 [Rubripirellula tenax]|uniref:Uncharacterized protein n=1 Tax=Rubripirellula tenax TaxID=2528015 RepID=A0A5C6FEZ4_9BACT|nr:hypothetical protein [Rubripirellula tenax]TWU58686.1 hypothetical protein Poly51_14650 [Rubripirellula tenax]
MKEIDTAQNKMNERSNHTELYHHSAGTSHPRINWKNIAIELSFSFTLLLTIWRIDPTAIGNEQKIDPIKISKIQTRKTGSVSGGCECRNTHLRREFPHS